MVLFCGDLGRAQQLDESSDEARHIRQLEQLLEQKESEMVRFFHSIIASVWMSVVEDDTNPHQHHPLYCPHPHLRLSVCIPVVMFFLLVWPFYSKNICLTD